ncbi:MAG: DUF1016 family protein [Rhodocyclaceae bacterium]|nr:MAG: DUF1016 family protein [Rhodocyclaceae bacterium]
MQIKATLTRWPFSLPKVNSVGLCRSFQYITGQTQYKFCKRGYGQELVKALSAPLTAEFGQGSSVSNLQLMRKFFIECKFRIQQQAAVKLTLARIHKVRQRQVNSDIRQRCCSDN